MTFDMIQHKERKKGKERRKAAQVSSKKKKERKKKEKKSQAMHAQQPSGSISSRLVVVKPAEGD